MNTEQLLTETVHSYALQNVFILNEYTCISVVLIDKTVMSNFEYVKYSSLLNTLKKSVLMISSTCITGCAVAPALC